MRILFMLGLLLSTVHANALTLFWWNVGGGNYDPQPNPAAPTSNACYVKNGADLLILEQNILARAFAPESPDILILGEYQRGMLSEQTFAQLKILYPFERSYLYSSTHDKALQMIVLSKLPLTGENVRFEELHWADAKTEAQNPKLNRIYLRSYQRLSFQVNGKTIHVVPIHALDPWPEMKRALGAVKTAQNLIFSDQHANAFQARQLQKILSSEDRWIGTDDAWVMLGDFNIPNNVLTFEPRGYTIFKAGFKAVPLSGPKATFPSVKCRHYQFYPDVKIDHAFVRGKFGTASGSVLDLEGSDHRAIQVKLDLK